MKRVESWLRKLDTLISEYPLLTIGLIFFVFLFGALLMVLVTIYLLADDGAKLQAASVFLSAFATSGAIVAVLITLIERRERQMQEANARKPNLIVVNADLSTNPDGMFHSEIVFANLSAHPIYIRDAVRTSDRSRTHWMEVLEGNLLLKAGESGITYKLDFPLTMFTYGSLVIYFNFALTGEALHSLEIPIKRPATFASDMTFVSYDGPAAFDLAGKTFSYNTFDMTETTKAWNNYFRDRQEE